LESHATAKELVRVLAYPKFKLAQAEQQALLADFFAVRGSNPWEIAEQRTTTVA
jgi:hypothetical protein